MANWVRDWLERSELSQHPIVLRARHSIHVRKPSGNHVAEFTGAPMHYRDSNGDWLPLDTRLRADAHGYSAPGGRVRVLDDGTVLDRGSAYWQRARAVGVVDAGGKFTALATLPDRGSVDGESFVREVGPFRHVARLHESGVREVLHVDPAWGGCAGSGERFAVASDAGTRSNGLHFGQPVTLDGTRLTQRRCLTLAPVGWLAGGLDPDFSANADDGSIRGYSDASYATARSTSTDYDATGSTMAVGQDNNYLNYWWVSRGFLRFDLSSIGASNRVLQVALKLVASADSSGTNFDVQIVKAAWTSTLAANQAADYALALSAALDDSIWRNTNGMATGTQYTSGNLDLTWVNKFGYTYYALRSSRDASNTEPSGPEYIDIATQNNGTAGHRPVLAITYVKGYPRALLGVGW